NQGEVNDVRLAGNAGEGERVSHALGVLKDARFEPARRAGRPVSAWASVQVGLRAAGSDGAAPSGVCASAATAVKNPAHQCFDTRPVPRVAPLARLPAA